MASNPQDGFPETFLNLPPADGVERPQVFEPAPKQYLRAFRQADPVLGDPEVARRWRAARRRAMDHVLRAAATSPWADALVLRGSRAMLEWFPGAAREPGDFDWVVSGSGGGKPHPAQDQIFEDVITAVAESEPPGAGLRLRTSDAAVDEIWTYSRVPGRRVVFPWDAPGLPGGAVQFDVVFDEPLPEPAERVRLTKADGAPIDVWAASPRTSLAWKLLWLATDAYPQGKDLYDAVLLAERATVSADVVARAFAGAGEPVETLVKAPPLTWNVDWPEFKREYSWVPADARDWQERLHRAIAPLLQSLASLPPDRRTRAT